MALSLATARESTEPVFNITDNIAFQDFRCVFRCGLEDPAFLNAVMLTLAFAAPGDDTTRECLEYATRAVGFVGKRISNPDWTTIEATLGTILLLAGVNVSGTHPKRSFRSCLCLPFFYSHDSLVKCNSEMHKLDSTIIFLSY